MRECGCGAQYAGRGTRCSPCANRKTKFGVTHDEYQAMLNAQDRRCGICRVHEDEEPRALGIDHCHDTGRIRGILCRKCNVGIGMLGDSLAAVESAVRYLS